MMIGRREEKMEYLVDESRKSAGREEWHLEKCGGHWTYRIAGNVCEELNFAVCGFGGNLQTLHPLNVLARVSIK